MFKLVLIVLGAAAGATGASAWLLSEPTVPAGSTPTAPDALQVRPQVLNARIKQAVADGQKAGRDTEDRLRRELDMYRRGDRPPTS